MEPLLTQGQIEEGEVGATIALPRTHAKLAVKDGRPAGQRWRDYHVHHALLNQDLCANGK